MIGNNKINHQLFKKLKSNEIAKYIVEHIKPILKKYDVDDTRLIISTFDNNYFDLNGNVDSLSELINKMK